jgi:Sulfotransferase family
VSEAWVAMKEAERSQFAEVLIYLHLPKCGGTTLSRLIEWEYNPTRIFTVDPSFFRWSYSRLIRWPQKRLDRMDVFKGHMPFGLHRRLSRPTTYITVLREPVERALSAYYFAASYRLHPDHRIVSRMTLEQFVKNKDYHNVQTKLLAGVDTQYDFLAGDCNQDMLVAAKENLARHFSVVGLTEQFEEVLALFKLRFGWNITRYTSFNVTRVREHKDQVPRSTLDLIGKLNRFDLELYEHVVPLAKNLFEQAGEAARRELATIVRAKALRRWEEFYHRGASRVRQGISRLCSTT